MENNFVFPVIVECFSGIGQCVIARIQRRNLNPVKHQDGSFCKNTIFKRYRLLRTAPSKMFGRVLNVLLEYRPIVFILFRMSL